MTNDDNIDLADAICAAKISTDQSQFVDFGHASIVDNDEKIGLDENLYVLQVVAGLRSKTVAKFFVDQLPLGKLRVLPGESADFDI